MHNVWTFFGYIGTLYIHRRRRNFQIHKKDRELHHASHHNSHLGCNRITIHILDAIASQFTSWIQYKAIHINRHIRSHYDSHLGKNHITIHIASRQITQYKAHVGGVSPPAKICQTHLDDSHRWLDDGCTTICKKKEKKRKKWKKKNGR